MRKNLYECLSQIKSNEKFERCNNFIGVDEKPHTNTLCEMEVESLNLFCKVGLKRGIFKNNNKAYYEYDKIAAPYLPSAPNLSLPHPLLTQSPGHAVPGSGRHTGLI